jgi:hypothetical protein
MNADSALNITAFKYLAYIINTSTIKILLLLLVIHRFA